MRIRSMLVAVVAVALTGCASYVSSNVTAFQDWQGSDRERTYTFDRGPEQQNDLEEQAYEQLVSQELSLYGFQPTPAARAHYAVNLAYGQRDTTGYMPQVAYGYDYGGFGGWGPGWGGGWGRHGWGPDPWGAPPQVVNVPYAAFASMLMIRIKDLQSGREVYKVSVRHVGEQVPLPVVMPYLVRSALFTFPMENGATREVKLPVDKNGRVQPLIGAGTEVPVAGAMPASGVSGTAARTSPAPNK